MYTGLRIRKRAFAYSFCFYYSELYGGPSQPPLGDPRGMVQKSHELAEKKPKEFINPGQYDNDSVSTCSRKVLLLLVYP
jgi:hypothetical protein